MITVAIKKNNCGTVMRQLEHEERALPEAIAVLIRDRAIEFAPVRTGRLKSRIRIENSGVSTVTVVSDTGGEGFREYAAYNEYGTRYMHAQPYMMPAVVASEPGIEVEGLLMGSRIETAAETGRVV